ncbi:unnamed protein product [Urochloa humidicola]
MWVPPHFFLFSSVPLARSLLLPDSSRVVAAAAAAAGIPPRRRRSSYRPALSVLPAAPSRAVLSPPRRPAGAVRTQGCSRTADPEPKPAVAGALRGEIGGGGGGEVGDRGACV